MIKYENNRGEMSLQMRGKPDELVADSIMLIGCVYGRIIARGMKEEAKAYRKMITELICNADMQKAVFDDNPFVTGLASPEAFEEEEEV